jgi:hypothetical protein
LDIQSEKFFDYKDIHPSIAQPKSNDHWRTQIKYTDTEDPDVYGEITLPMNKEEVFAEACEYIKGCKTRKQMYAPCPHLKTISSKVTFCENSWKTQKAKKTTKSSYTMTPASPRRWLAGLRAAAAACSSHHKANGCSGS